MYQKKGTERIFTDIIFQWLFFNFKDTKGYTHKAA